MKTKTKLYDCREVWTMGFDAACAQLADRAITAYTHQISPALYLFGYKDRLGRYSEITLARDEPRYSEMVTLTHIPRDMDAAQLAGWFRERLRREPVLGAVIRPIREAEA